MTETTAPATTRYVSHDKAAEIASRLIAGAFNRTDNRPRFSIPCRPDHDDDCLIMSYIGQQKEADKPIADMTLDELQNVICSYMIEIQYRMLGSPKKCVTL